MGIERSKRPQSAPEYRPSTLFVSTSASTALARRGAVGLASTGAIVVWTLTPPKPGEVLTLTMDLAGTSSGIFHINAGTGVAFAGMVASTEDMVTLSSGGSVSLLGKSTARWYVTGSHNASLSSST